MPRYIEVASLITMFRSSYRYSALRGDEIARIIELRFGDTETAKKPTTDAERNENGGQNKGSNP